MMNLFSAIAASVLSLAVGLPALAQTTTQTAPSTGAAVSQAADARVNARIAMLHERLSITAAEEPSWQAFTAVMRQNAQEQGQALAQRQQTFASMNAVEDLQSYAELTKRQSEQIGRLVGPFQTLYTQLSPQQKSAADQIFQNYTARAGHSRG